MSDYQRAVMDGFRWKASEHYRTIDGWPKGALACLNCEKPLSWHSKDRRCPLSAEQPDTEATE